MISRVRGRLIVKELERVEVMTGAGVGYEVHVPARLHDRLPEEGDEVELHTALVVRDDDMDLFGFVSARDRELFLRLQDASGVGPRLALAALGELPGSRLVRAIRAKDHDVLRTVTGVGKKTAERIALELSDKLDDLSGEEAAEPATAADSAVQALRSLGYGARESEQAVHQARQEAGDGELEELGTEELVKRALQNV
ncbi:MAG: Holliday junction branch migration protein RuvA [Gemmatimonadota bacterium]